MPQPVDDIRSNTSDDVQHLLTNKTVFFCFCYPIGKRSLVLCWNMFTVTRSQM